MTIQLQFRVKFTSDWHISAGYGIGTTVDSALERDPDGIPIIRGATLKGLFRDALYDLNSHWTGPDTLPDTILGSVGQTSPWVFSTAYPVEHEQLPFLQVKEDLSHVVPGVRVDPRTRRAEVGKLYQREMGSTEYAFLFTVSGDWQHTEVSPQEAVEWLVVAARYIRGLGARRRRGAGRCRIELIETSEADGLQALLLDAFEQRHSGQVPGKVDIPHVQENYVLRNPDETARRFRIILRTDAPMIVAQKLAAGNVFESQLSIPGQTLRGALAARMNPNQLSDEAYAQFLELIVWGNAVFDDMLAVVPDSEQIDQHTIDNSSINPVVDGYVMDDIPLGLVKNRAGEIASVLTDSHSDFKGFKSLSGSIMLTDGMQVLTKDDVSKLLPLNTHMHVQIDPDTKRAEEGNLYAYDAIPAGRYFVGEVRLSPETPWSILSELLRANLYTPFSLRVGKGRNRGYGACTIWIEPLDNSSSLHSQMPLTTRLNHSPARVLLTLATDTILLDEWNRAIQRFEKRWLAKALNIEDHEFDIAGSAVRTQLVEGFDTFSGLPRWRDVALMKGSTVVLDLHIDSLAKIAHFEHLELHGIGLRRNEGFGRVIFNHPLHWQIETGFELPIVIPETLVSSRQVSDQTRSAFVDWWRTYLHKYLQQSLFVEKGRLGEPYRALAHRLIELHPSNAQKAAEILDALGQPDAPGQAPYFWPQSYLANSQKDKRYSQAALEQIKSLLTDLNANYPMYWQRGLIMLAEMLLSFDQQKEQSV